MRILLQRARDLMAEQVDGADEPVHFTRELAALVIEEYSKPQDVVLDPFAGFGTTLEVAAERGRRAVGIELLPERVDLIRARVQDATVIEGDSRRLLTLVSEPVDLVLTSPPYMSPDDHPDNPLTGYATEDGDYATYLREVAGVFDSCLELLRPGGHLAVNVANVRVGGSITPLAWDIGRHLARRARFVDEVTLVWDQPPDWLASDHLLIFRTAEES